MGGGEGRGGGSSQNWALTRSSEFWPQADIVFDEMENQKL